MTEKDKKNAEVTEEKVKNQAKQATTEETPEKEDKTTDNKKEEEAPKEEKKSSKKKKLNKKDQEIEDLGIKLSEVSDKYIRLSAEFDNYRKRTLKEKSDILKTAGGAVLEGLLPVVDDFERGIQHMDTAEDVAAVKEGVELIYAKFKEYLKIKGIQEMEALNQDFDTDFHEALTKIPAPSKKLKGKVVDVIQKGYKIDDKVIRFAKVVIGE